MSLIEEHINQPVYVAPEKGRNARAALLSLLEDTRERFTVEQMQQQFIQGCQQALLSRIAWTANTDNAKLTLRMQAWHGWDIFRTFWNAIERPYRPEDWKRK